MKNIVALLASTAAFGALAQGIDRNSDAYRAGYEDGFARGYQKGIAEAQAAPPPASTKATGPITISRAVYGTSSKSCDATRWLARKANGRMTASVEVTNDICGDPSPGSRKSLDVTYVCGSIAKTANAFEHRNVDLDCSP
jgi:hypothetical protein